MRTLCLYPSRKVTKVLCLCSLSLFFFSFALAQKRSQADSLRAVREIKSRVESHYRPSPENAQKIKAALEKAAERKSDDGRSTDAGVVVGGVTWATRNVGESGTFVATPGEYGRYYTWKAARKVCPKGWRLPTNEEFERLEASEFEWKDNGVSFGGGKLFFPAAGYRGLGRKKPYLAYGVAGYYWSGTKGSKKFSYYLNFDAQAIYPVSCFYDLYGYPVRCVKE